MESVAADAAPVASAVIVNTLVPALDVEVVFRVIRLTWFTFASEILSPFLNVSPVVHVTLSDEPDWFAPFTVTAPAHVPAVCVASDIEAYQSKLSDFSTNPVRNCFVMSLTGLW